METKMAPPKTKVAPIVLDLASELSLSDLPLNLRQDRCANKPGGCGCQGWCCRTYVEGTNADQI